MKTKLTAVRAFMNAAATPSSIITAVLAIISFLDYCPLSQIDIQVSGTPFERVVEMHLNITDVKWEWSERDLIERAIIHLYQIWLLILILGGEVHKHKNVQSIRLNILQ